MSMEGEIQILNKYEKNYFIIIIKKITSLSLDLVY